MVFLLVVCLLFTGCAQFDPGEFPQVDAETLGAVPDGMSKVQSESANSMSAHKSTYTFNAESLICFELAYEDAAFSVRCEDTDGNVLFSQPQAQPGIYSIPVEKGRYKIIMSYELTNGFYVIYAD